MNQGSNSTLLSVLKNFNTLERFLLEAFPLSKSNLKQSDLSRSFLKRPCTKRQPLSLPLNLINKGMVNPLYSGPNINIIFENADLLALNKPYNIHGHPLNYCEKDNVLSFLRSIGYGKYLFGTDNEKGLLYRLDYVTSGVLIYIKNQELHQFLRDNFHEIAKNKRYIAIVDGDFSFVGKHTHSFSSAGNNKHKVVVNKTENGKVGTIIINKKSYCNNKNVSLLEIKLESGLRHQIRSQLAFLGSPIIGDVLYGGREAERIYLHALEYTIKINNALLKICAKKANLFERFFVLDSFFDTDSSF